MGESIYKNRARKACCFLSLTSMSPLAHVAPFPVQVFDLLPPVVQACLPYFERTSEQAVFVTGLLPVGAAVLSPGVEFLNRDGYNSPDLYTCIVAPPSSGKGALRWARAAGADADRRMTERADLRRMEFEEMSAKEQKGLPRPAFESFYLPANSASASLIRALDATRGAGIIFEEEIDSLAATLQQDWGDFSDLLRKAFHHEPVSFQRSGERIYMERPRLSMCLSGTPKQFKRLFVSAENGLFSRYLFFCFEDYQDWTSQRPQTWAHDRRQHFGALSVRLADLHETLSARRVPIRMQFTREQWERHDAAYRAAQQMMQDRGAADEIISSVRRSGIIATRIATVLACLRAWDGGEDMYAAASVRATDDDLTCALAIARMGIDHAAAMLAYLNDEQVTPPPSDQSRKMLDSLPERFGRMELAEAAAANALSERTARRYRDGWLEACLIEKDGWGQYVKAGSRSHEIAHGDGLMDSLPELTSHITP